jgi:hypothetical protein
MRIQPAILAFCLLPACAADVERPPTIAVCEDADCIPQGSSNGNSGSGSGGAPPDDEIVVLTGTVAAINDDRFVALSTYSGAATLLAQSASGQAIEVAFDGRAFAFTDIRRGQGTPVQVVPDQAEYMPVVSVLDTTEPQGGVVLPVLRRSVLDEMVVALSSQAVIDETRGHVVLSLVDESDRGVSGVFVSAGAAGDVAYQVGGTWTDVAIGTEPAGLAVVFNLPASRLGTSGASLGLSGSVDDSVVVPVVSGAVTLARYRVLF